MATINVRFEILMTLTMKTAVSWDAVLCNLVSSILAEHVGVVLSSFQKFKVKQNGEIKKCQASSPVSQM
jgi:hypothetical protein